MLYETLRNSQPPGRKRPERRTANLWGAKPPPRSISSGVAEPSFLPDASVLVDGYGTAQGPTPYGAQRFRHRSATIPPDPSTSGRSQTRTPAGTPRPLRIFRSIVSQVISSLRATGTNPARSTHPNSVGAVVGLSLGLSLRTTTEDPVAGSEGVTHVTEISKRNSASRRSVSPLTAMFQSHSSENRQPSPPESRYVHL